MISVRTILLSFVLLLFLILSTLVIKIRRAKTFSEMTRTATATNVLLVVTLVLLSIIQVMDIMSS